MSPRDKQAPALSESSPDDMGAEFAGLMPASLLTTSDVHTLLARPPAARFKGAGRVAAYSFWKMLTNPFSLGFAMALPIFMYLMFGANQEYSDYPVGHANVAATVLVNMVWYGVIMTTSSMGANVSLERTSGVSRLFALTPLSSSAQILARSVAAVGVAAVVVAVTYLVGAFTGASMEGPVWLYSGLLVLAMAFLPAAMGLAAGFAVRSEGVYAVTSIVAVVCAFASGMFMPLESMGEMFQNIAPWTPFFGALKIVQSPLVGWGDFSWTWVVNLLVWFAIMGGIAAWAQRRDTAR